MVPTAYAKAFAGVTPAVKVTILPDVGHMDLLSGPTAVVGTYRPTDPGTRTVEATARGYKKATATVMLAEGGKESCSKTCHCSMIGQFVALFPGR